MRSLFKRLDQAFDRGARAATLTCYRRLLMLLTQDAESGLFCGIKTPIEMLDIKLSDTLSRYFRSVYDCADRQSRVAQLAQAMIELSGLDRSLGLQSLIVVSHDKLNDFEDFLIEWQNYWRTRPCDRSLVSLQQWTVICQCFVREASQLIRGLPGLAWLARERGATQAESYFHWISRLIEVQDWVAAERAAREASERIQEPVSCALVSEVYAVIAAQNDSLNASLSALKQAFRKAPSPRRLCNLLLAHPLESRAKTLRIEIEQSFVDAEHFDDRTLSFMDFLAGRFEAALVRFQNAPELGWSDDEHPGRLLLPAFLWVCRREIDPQSIIKRIWRSVGRTIQSPEADQNLAAVFSSCGLQDREYWIDLVRPDSTILMSQLIAPDDLSTQRKKVLEQELKALVVHRVRTIVSKKYRKAYDRAATASVAVAELLASTEPESYLLPELKTIFPRHRAFLRELRKMAELSPVDLHFP